MPWRASRPHREQREAGRRGLSGTGCVPRDSRGGLPGGGDVDREPGGGKARREDVTLTRGCRQVWGALAGGAGAGGPDCAPSSRWQWAPPGVSDAESLGFSSSGASAVLRMDSQGRGEPLGGRELGGLDRGREVGPLPSSIKANVPRRAPVLGAEPGRDRWASRPQRRPAPPRSRRTRLPAETNKLTEVSARSPLRLQTGRPRLEGGRWVGGPQAGGVRGGAGAAWRPLPRVLLRGAEWVGTPATRGRPQGPTSWTPTG